jgi:hypothetical protein
VTVANDAPPYALPVPDPATGYTTRYLGTALGVFLPHHTVLEGVYVNGIPYHPVVRLPRVPGVYDRRFFATPMMLDYGQSSTVNVRYKVPNAAQLTSATAMTYQLDVDPQDLVVPETLKVSLTWPSGWTPTSALPAGWLAAGTNGASYQTSVGTKLAFEIPLANG